MKCFIIVANVFHTFAWEEGAEIKSVDSARIVSGAFSYADGLNLDINYLGDKVSTQTWSSPLGVTYPSANQGIFKLSGATVEINAAGDTGFTSGDKFYPSGIDVAITRGFEGLAVTAGNNAIGEPVEKAAPMVEVTLTFPKKETQTAAYFAAFGNRDYKKMRITFVSDAIPTTASFYTLQFDFPKVMVMEAPDFAQDTPIPTTIKFKALKADAAPAIMSEAVSYISLTNTASASGNYPTS